MAFMSVDLPAPLLPISPTISPLPTLERDAVDGGVAAEGHPQVGDGERRDAAVAVLGLGRSAAWPAGASARWRRLLAEAPIRPGQERVADVVAI